MPSITITADLKEGCIMLYSDSIATLGPTILFTAAISLLHRTTFSRHLALFSRFSIYLCILFQTLDFLLFSPVYLKCFLEKDLGRESFKIYNSLIYDIEINCNCGNIIKLPSYS